MGRPPSASPASSPAESPASLPAATAARPQDSAPNSAAGRRSAALVMAEPREPRGHHEIGRQVMERERIEHHPPERQARAVQRGDLVEPEGFRPDPVQPRPQGRPACTARRPRASAPGARRRGSNRSPASAFPENFERPAPAGKGETLMRFTGHPSFTCDHNETVEPNGTIPLAVAVPARRSGRMCGGAATHHAGLRRCLPCRRLSVRPAGAVPARHALLLPGPGRALVRAGRMTGGRPALSS